MDKTIALRTLILLLAVCTQSKALPKPVTNCLARHPDLSIDLKQKPPYLQLHFTAAGKPDYVVAVREPESDRYRALVCMYNGQDFVLGARAGKQPFSDMKDDNYMSSSWRVCAKKEVAEFRQYYKDVPEPVNEAVCLVWEDAEALIYWDGKQLRWKSFWP